MGSNNEKYQAVGQDDKIDASVKRENDRPSIQGRPNIDEISKRNEEEKRLKEEEERRLKEETEGRLKESQEQEEIIQPEEEKKD